MSKGIRWEIPFVSLLGKRYVVEIYDEQGEWSGVTTLTGGTSPFTTEENSDSDLFNPIRTQNATIQICTAIPNGGTLHLDDIMPSNNTERPVRLCRIDDIDPSIRYVEWMGFLSCEVYSQDYVGIPNIISISAISILEAMGNVECDISKFYGVQRVYNIFGYVFGEIQDKYGLNFGNIYISGEGYQILYKFVNTSIFYETKERINGNAREEYIVGLTLKDVLITITQFMGWCAREQGTDFYLQTMLNDHRMLVTTVAQLNEMQPTLYTFVSTTLSDIANLAWRGTDHQKSVKAGARSVEVVANLKGFDIDLGIPGFPKGDYIIAEEGVPIPPKEEGETPQIATVYISKELKFSNRCDLQVFDIEDYNLPPFFELVLINDVNKLYVHSYYDDLQQSINTVAGAAMIRMLNRSADYDKQGVYVRGTDLVVIKNDIVESDYVMKLRSIDHLCGSNGRIIIDFDGMFTDGTSLPNGYYISVVVKWGNKYLQPDLTTWSTTFTYVSIIKQDNPLEIEIVEYNYGEVSLMVMPFTLRDTDGLYSIQEYIITDLSLSYVVPEEVFDDNSTNTYYEPLHTSFREEESVSVDIASSFKNIPSPSLILNIDPDRRYDPLTSMIFYAGEEIDERPEIMLLNKMAEYYKIPRTLLKLDVEMPSTSLPLLQLKGINDGKVYLPVASTRDWITDVSQLYCSETNPWLVIKSDGQLWDRESSLLIHGDGASVILNFTSPFDLTWRCRVFGELQDVYINGSAGSGTISAGVDVPVVFLLDEEENENGWVDFYQNGKLVASIYIVAEY